MGGYFSAVSFSQQHKQICYDSSDSQNSISPDACFNKIHNDHNKERSLNQLSHENREKLNEFKLELARKHEKRRKILADKRQEMEDLRREVLSLKKENEELKKGKTECKPGEREYQFEIERLRNENEELKKAIKEKDCDIERFEVLSQKNNELRVQIAEMQKELQELNRDVLNFDKEREEYQNHVVALKDVIKVTKNMLQIRESQLKELKEKVESIETALAGREMNILSQDLRNEYERQLQNIRNLKQLYEERHRAYKLEKDELVSKLEDTKKELEAEEKKAQELKERITELENENSNKYDEIKSLESNLGLSKAECREYQAELSVINQLFSEILLGFNNTQDIDLDKLKTLLVENHGLLQNIVVNEISKEASSALPKVLLDLLNQVTEKDQTQSNCDDNKIHEAEVTESTESRQKLKSIPEETESQTNSIHQLNSVDEIVENLPKVWRILIELLSHQKSPVNDISEEPETQNNPCYKTVETSKGPNLVLSVSQTFIRLKDLILEKKALEKETNHLKQLNTHLETRLQDQEKRLGTVTNELSKTWHVVGKLQKQHQLLHTQEKILRYELAQKRKLLGQLKEELEYSREKRLQAKEKNSTTEREWRKLRTEFASRRNITTEDCNNSCESGYSDDKECSSDDEPGYETDVSEGNQKLVEDSEDISDKGVINNLEEILEESNEVNTVEQVLEDCNDNNLFNAIIQPSSNLEDVSQNSSSTNEVHSALLKTDLVQVNDIEKTESTNLPESNHSLPSCSSSTDPIQPNTSNEMLPSINTLTNSEPERPRKTLEEVLAARDARLKRLESETLQLVTKVTNTNIRSVDISNKLDGLHETYGESSNTTEQTEISESPEGSIHNANDNNQDTNINEE